MNSCTLQDCINRHLENAKMVFALDNELGLRYGLSWADFVLLTVVDAEGGEMRTADLARSLHISASHLLLRLLPLEKIGIVERIIDTCGNRHITLRSQGRRVLNEARETAAHTCAH